MRSWPWRLPPSPLPSLPSQGGAIAEEAAVAKNVNTGATYTTLQAAVDAAGTGDTVQLLKSTTESVSIGAGDSLTVDLGGNTLTGVSDPHPDDEAIALYLSRCGAVTIKNGTISADCTTSADARAAVVAYSCTGTVTFDGVSMTVGRHDGDKENGVFVALYIAECTAEVEGCTATGNGNSYALFVDNGTNKKATIKTGTFNGAVANASVDANGFSIEGGKFSNLLVRVGESAYDAIAKYLVADKTLEYKSDGASKYYTVVDAGDTSALSALKNDSGWMLAAPTGEIYYEHGTDKSVVAADVSSLNLDESLISQIFRASFVNGTDEVAHYGYYSGDALGTLPDAPSAPAGKKFAGWFTTAGDRATDTTKVTADVTYYAKWDDIDGVAEYNGRKYEKLQDAIDDAAKNGGTVKLLKDTTERVTIAASGKDVTLDLGDKELAQPSEGENFTVKVTGSGNVVIENGAIAGQGKVVYVDKSYNEGVNLTLKGTSVTTSATNDAAVYFEGTGNAAKPSSLTINGGTYVATGTNAPALRVDEGATLSVMDGNFESEADGTILIRDAATKADLDCDVKHHINLDAGAKAENVTVHIGATFGDASNAKLLADGLYFYKGGHDADNEYDYKVIDLESDEYQEGANWVVYSTDDETADIVYFETGDDAKAYAALFDDATYIPLHRVTFEANGDQYDRRVYEDYEEIGELPSGSDLEVEGYTFAGWYVDGKKIDSHFKVEKDTVAVAMWYKNGSGDDPVVDPTDDDGKSDGKQDDKGNKDDKRLPQTGDPALAISGIVAAGVAIAGIGVVRRRK